MREEFKFFSYHTTDRPYDQMIVRVGRATSPCWLWLCKEMGKKMNLELVQNFDGGHLLLYIVFDGTTSPWLIEL
jgi:hypothetical protein